MTTPLFNSYGAFRNDELFEKLFEGEAQFRKGQNRAAGEIVNQILRHCDGEQHFPRITSIVDIGCGDGSLLTEIKAALDDEIKNRVDRNKSKEIPSSTWKIDKYIGIDQCEGMIKKARSSGDGSILYFPMSMTEAFIDASNELAIDWPNTALLCLGHTWFHMLDQNTLINQIGQKRPALLLVDVFQSWDDVVGDLIEKFNRDSEHKDSGTITFDAQSKPRKLSPILRDEETRVLPLNGSPCKYSLRTQLLYSELEHPAEVVRGIYAEPSGADGYWVFASHQVAKLTAELRPLPNRKDGISGISESNSPIDVLRRAAVADGELTAQNDYIVLREFHHVSGWGNMHCIALAALLPEAKALNEAYFEAVSGLVRDLFLEPCYKERYGGLRKLLDIFGRGEVAAVMPFDPIRTFARMVPLVESQCSNDSAENDSANRSPAISTIDLILEQPNRWQLRFPTAYGLYHTMLDLVSSPVSFPSSRVPGYEQAFVDEKYEDIETEFLNASRKNDSKYNGNSFFIVPYYVGTLPLFALVLEEPQGFPANATNGQVYYSLAQNLERQLDAVIDRRIVRSHIMAPFLVGALQRFNKSSTRTEANRIVQTRLLDAMENKPWKSWVTALPSHTLRSLDAFRLENAWLKQLADDECVRLGENIITQVSLWFEVEEYFSDSAAENAHDNFFCCTHQERLSRLPGLRDNTSLVESGYFEVVASPKNTNILLFTDSLIRIMRKACDKTTCGKEGANCGNYEEKWWAYLAAKRLFCRERANSGKLYRFSFLRLFGALLAASGVTWDEEAIAVFKQLNQSERTIAESLGEFKIDKRITFDRSESLDFADEIATRVAFLSHAGSGVNRISVETGPYAEIADDRQTAKLGMTLMIETKKGLKPLGGNELKEAGGISVPIDQPEKNKWTLNVSAELEASGSTLSIEWSLQ